MKKKTTAKAKRKNPIELEMEMDDAFTQIENAIKALNKLRRSFGRLLDCDQEWVLETLEWCQNEIDECAWTYQDKRKEILEARKAKELKKSGKTEPPTQKTTLPPLSDFLAPLFDRIALNMEAINEGMPIALEKRRQRELEAQGKFDWPDAIDTEGRKIESKPKQLPPKTDEGD